AIFFLFLTRPPPGSPLFPYTTLFRSREAAQHELAQDFLKAGMLDRAEAAYEAVLDTRYAVPAVRALIRIYESEHDWPRAVDAVRSEEHTSELQSRENLVCRLLLEKKK